MTIRQAQGTAKRIEFTPLSPERKRRTQEKRRPQTELSCLMISMAMRPMSHHCRFVMLL